MATVNEQHQTDLQIGDVDSLLAGFLWLKHPPEPLAPPRSPDLWAKAVDEAWQAERKHAEKKALAASVGKGGGAGAAMADFRRRSAERKQLEKATGKPCFVLLSGRFRQVAMKAYQRLEPAYAKAEADARKLIADETAKVRKGLDLLLVSIKRPLLELSELADRGPDGSKGWGVYQAAVHKSKPDALAAVVQDLERIKAKLERHEEETAREARGGNAVRQCPRPDCGGRLYVSDEPSGSRYACVLRCDKCGKGMLWAKGGDGRPHGMGLRKPTEDHKALARDVRAVLAATAVSRAVEETIRAVAADRVKRRKKHGKIDPLFPPSDSLTVGEMVFLLASFHDQLAPYTGLPRVCPPEWIDKRLEDGASEEEIAGDVCELTDSMASDVGAQFSMYRRAVDAVMLSDSELDDLGAYLGDVKVWASERAGCGDTVQPDAKVIPEHRDDFRSTIKDLTIGILTGAQAAQKEDKARGRAGTSDGPEDNRHLSRRVAKVWADFQDAIVKGKFDDSPPKDREVYEWLLIHRRKGEDLPRLPTWQRYLREARKFHGHQKNTPRGGRATGRSIDTETGAKPVSASERERRMKRSINQTD